MLLGSNETKSKKSFILITHTGAMDFLHPIKNYPYQLLKQDHPTGLSKGLRRRKSIIRNWNYEQKKTKIFRQKPKEIHRVKMQIMKKMTTIIFES